MRGSIEQDLQVPENLNEAGVSRAALVYNYELKQYTEIIKEAMKKHEDIDIINYASLDTFCKIAKDRVNVAHQLPLTPQDIHNIC